MILAEVSENLFSSSNRECLESCLAVDGIYSQIITCLEKIGVAIKRKELDNAADDIGRALGSIALLLEVLDYDNSNGLAFHLDDLYRKVAQNLARSFQRRDRQGVESSCRYVMFLRDLWRQEVLSRFSDELDVTIIRETLSMGLPPEESPLPMAAAMIA